MLKQLWVIHGIHWILLESLDQKCKALIKESGRERERGGGGGKGGTSRRQWRDVVDVGVEKSWPRACPTSSNISDRLSS